MKQFLHFLGDVSGVIGALICLVAGLSRIAGSYWMLGFQLGTLFLAGTALMIFGCFLKLRALARAQSV